MLGHAFFKIFFIHINHRTRAIRDGKDLLNHLPTPCQIEYSSKIGDISDMIADS